MNMDNADATPRDPGSAQDFPGLSTELGAVPLTTRGLKRRILQNTAVLLGAIIICFAGLELFVRVTVEVPLFPRYVTKRQLTGGPTIRQNIPFARYSHSSIDGTWEFSINANGFRNNRDFAYLKPSGTFRVLVLGDSFTVGYEVKQEETFSARLQQELSDSLALNVEVLNAGMSGMGTAEEYAYLKYEGLRFDPDVVVLGFFQNDYADSMRSGLYSVIGTSLWPAAPAYAPATTASDLLYGIPGYPFLAQHSMLYALVNERLGIFVKRIFFPGNVTNADGGPAQASVELVRALLQQMAEDCSNLGIPFVVLDIAPTQTEDSLTGPALPEQDYSLVRSRDFYATCCPSGIFRKHGHGHWTPDAHAEAGKMLARAIIRGQRLGE